MSVHAVVDQAVKALVAAAATGAQVVGLDASEAVPERLAAGGRVVVRDGDPGQPEITLSPLTYCYDRTIGIEVTAVTSAEVDAILTALSAAIVADRTLGGLVEFLDATAPLVEAQAIEGAPVLAEGSATIVASYSTSQPL